MPETIKFYTHPSPIVGDGAGEDDILPEGKMIVASVKLVLPVAASRKDIMEWLALHLGFGSMATDNPLGEHTPEAFEEPELTEMPFVVIMEVSRS